MHLAELADVQMGFPFRSRLEHDPEGDVAVIQMKDIDAANRLQAQGAIKVILPKNTEHHLLHPGDLLFRSRGRSNGTAQVPDGIGPAVLSAPMLRIRPQHVLPEYLCWFLNAQSSQDQLATLAKGTSVLMISAEALKSLDVPLPPLAMQQHIALAAALAEQEQTLRAQIAALRQRLTTHLLMTFAHEGTQ